MALTKIHFSSEIFPLTFFIIYSLHLFVLLASAKTDISGWNPSQSCHANNIYIFLFFILCITHFWLKTQPAKWVEKVLFIKYFHQFFFLQKLSKKKELEAAVWRRGKGNKFDFANKRKSNFQFLPLFIFEGSQSVRNLFWFSLNSACRHIIIIIFWLIMKFH